MDFFDFLGDAFQSVIESPITSLADAATSVVSGALGLADNAYSSLFGDSATGKMAADTLFGGATEAAPDVISDAVKPRTAGILGGAQDWVKQNPIAAMTIAGGIANAFTPNAIDMQNNRFKNQMELEEWRRRYAGANTNVSNVNIGMKPSGKPLTDSSGRGIMR